MPESTGKYEAPCRLWAWMTVVPAMIALMVPWVLITGNGIYLQAQKDQGGSVSLLLTFCEHQKEGTNFKQLECFKKKLL